MRAAAAVRGRTARVELTSAGAAGSLDGKALGHIRKLPTAASNITTTCVEGLANSNRPAHDSAARTRRGQSGQRLRAMLHTAWATTATAVSRSPCKIGSHHPRAPCGASAVASIAKAYISKADGKVNPTQAATAPRQPALCK